MAEAEGAAHGGWDFLKTKVGPMPAGAWIAAGAGIWWYLKRRQSSSTGTATGAQTDPAGNTGTIDPATGYVYGTPEDTAALSAQSAGSSSGTTGTGGSTTAGQYPDNASWGRAAINLLVGQGIDPTSANSAIEQYLASQTLTTQQQADVNLAIQALGAPPDPPAPGSAPSPIVTAPSPGPTYATNPPTGLSVTPNGPNSASAKWNSTSNAAGYSVTYRSGGGAAQTVTVTGTDTTATLSGLQPSSSYTVQVQATPARPGDGFATASFQTPAGTGAGPVAGTPPVLQSKGPAPASGGGNAQYVTVTVVKFQGNPPPWNATLSGIAQHYGTTVQTIMSANPGITNANLIYPGQTIKVPVK